MILIGRETKPLHCGLRIVVHEMISEAVLCFGIALLGSPPKPIEPFRLKLRLVAWVKTLSYALFG